MVMVEGLKMFRRNMQAGARNQVMRCDQRFKPENKLEKHEFTVHNKRFQCMHCDKTFQRSYHRDRHVQAWDMGL